jgi:TPR repeat protein
MRNIFFTIISLIVLFNAKAQSSNLSDIQKNLKINNLYQQGLAYKNGINVDIDFQKAFQFFSQGAALGDAQCQYAVAYMLFKGLGCIQDYQTAAQIFATGAKAGRDNSSYFYGLCLRNGYGVQRNEDSAKYYLQYAAKL